MPSYLSKITLINAIIIIISVSFSQISAQVFSPEDKRKPFLTVEGEWNGLMVGKWADGRTEKFVDVRTLEIIKKRTKPVAQQEPNESRRMWKDVTAGLK